LEWLHSGIEPVDWPVAEETVGGSYHTFGSAEFVEGVLVVLPGVSGGVTDVFADVVDEGPGRGVAVLVIAEDAEHVPQGLAQPVHHGFEVGPVDGVSLASGHESTLTVTTSEWS